jgi:predicted O-linked N-acetylglucosamine transferase (SPINDLY family)
LNSIREIFKQASESFITKEHQAQLAALEKAVAELRVRDREPDAYIETARCHQVLGSHEQAITLLREGIERCAPSAKLYRRFIRVLEDANRTAEALELARTARLKFPTDFLFELQERLLLPMLYSDSDEVDLYRRRFAEGVREIVEGLRLDTPEARESCLSGLKHHHNFQLAYQGLDVRELQVMYGELAHRIMAANYPDWVQPLRMPPDDGPLRIGYVSANLRNHSVAKDHLGWLEEHNRDRFQVFSYYLGSENDSRTEDARRASFRFRHLPDDLEEICRAILSDRLHVLVFLDIGMDPRMTQLGALRLAPIQCTTWGHPVTSGLPTIDYFLSSELMEPEGAQSSYSEKLVNLPGVGICYRKPVIPKALFYKTRADFGIQEDAIAYLSCQSTIKYLPQHDDVFPAIAKCVPNAQFVFVAWNDALRDDFQRRLDKAFSTAGVPIAGRVVFVPTIDEISYWNLNVLCDIFLDTIEWSGCNSTFEAIACKLPVVTLPGRFMRGRHSCAILSQLSVTDTIARDKSNYVEIATNLALDREWREQVVERLVAGSPALYSDKSSVHALEDFYQQSVSGRLLTQRTANGATRRESGRSKAEVAAGRGAVT